MLIEAIPPFLVLPRHFELSAAAIKQAVRVGTVHVRVGRSICATGEDFCCEYSG
jgi:hypothetical protein